MPDIHYSARGFNANPPTATLPEQQKPTAGVGWDGVMTSSLLDVVTEAVAVGDSGIFTNQPKRSALQKIWRAATIEAFLEESSEGFVLSTDHETLDGTERAQVSYHLGMAQAALVAREALKVQTTVHSDLVLKLLYGKIAGKVAGEKRPDLLGYSFTPNSPKTFPRVLLEAKGTMDGTLSKPLNDALEQLNSPRHELVRLIGTEGIRAASVAYFPARRGMGAAPRVWASHFADPPGGVVEDPLQISDNEFTQLLNLAQLLPIRWAIDEVREELPERVEDDYAGGFVRAKLPFTDTFIALPTQIYTFLGGIDTPLLDRRAAASELEEFGVMIAKLGVDQLTEGLTSTSQRARVLPSRLAVTQMVYA